MKKKKLVSLALSAVLCAALAAPAYAYKPGDQISPGGLGPFTVVEHPDGRLGYWDGSTFYEVDRDPEEPAETPAAALPAEREANREPPAPSIVWDGYWFKLTEDLPVYIVRDGELVRSGETFRQGQIVTAKGRTPEGNEMLSFDYKGGVGYLALATLRYLGGPERTGPAVTAGGEDGSRTVDFKNLSAFPVLEVPAEALENKGDEAPDVTVLLPKGTLSRKDDPNVLLPRHALMERLASGGKIRLTLCDLEGEIELACDQENWVWKYTGGGAEPDEAAAERAVRRIARAVGFPDAGVSRA